MTEVFRSLTAALADRYRIERELGQGGMATVYLAQDLKHNRQVAIKVLREDLAASMGAARFLREIQIAAQLQHPHILPLLDSGEASGFLYYVMPYVKGQSLRERLAREGELPITEAVHLLTEVVDALAAAHEHGVVHRDIKPDNVMLSGRHALVTDFGVAKAISDAAGRNTITTLGVAVGTPAYMSPEQAAADAHIDHRSDIYSVGVMAYEMLTGSPPFTGNTAQQVLAAQVTQEPDPISRRRASIPPALGQVVMRCLAKRPADRWQSASELLAALEPLTTPSAGITPTSTRPMSAVRAPARRGLIIGGAVVGLVAIAAVAAMMAKRHPRTSATAALPIKLTYTGKVWGDITMSPDGSYIAYYEARDCAAGTDCRPRLILQETAANGSRTVIDSSGSDVAGWSPDGKRYVLISYEGGRKRASVRSVLGSELVHDIGGRAMWSASPDSLLRWDWTPAHDSSVWIRTVDATTAAAGDSFRLAATTGVGVIRASPDGRFLLVLADSRVIILSRTGAVIDSVPGFDENIGWGPRSDRIYLERDRGNQAHVLRQDLDRNGKRLGLPREVIALDAVAMSIRGAALAYVERGSPQREVWTVEWKAGPSHPPVTRRVYQSTADGFAYPSRDGQRVFVAEYEEVGDSGDGRVRVMPFAGGPLLPFAGPRLLRYNMYWVSVSEDESHGIVGQRRNGRIFLTLLDNLLNGTGRELKTSFAERGWAMMLPGQRVLWMPSSGHEVVILDSLGAIVARPAWPDSLGSLVSLLPAADGSALAAWGVSQGGDSTLARMYRISLPDGKISFLAGPFGGAEWAGPWSTDGWLPLIRHDSGGRDMLIRIARTGGKIVVDGPLPQIGSEQTFTYDADRRRAVMWVINRHSDIFLLRNFDPDP